MWGAYDDWDEWFGDAIFMEVACDGSSMLALETVEDHMNEYIIAEMDVWSSTEPKRM